MKNLCTHASGHTSPATVPVPLNSKNRKAFSRRPNNILVILLSVSLLLSSQFSTAQAPQQFSFQGVARGADGKIVANAEIGYSFNLHEGNADGTIVFTREGSTTTNGSGIFNITVGTAASPIPATLEWAAKSFFLQVGIDPDGATNGYTFIDIGTTQLLSVPYALYSNEAGKWRNDVPVIQKGDFSKALPDLPAVGNGATLIWHPKKAAFRAGYVQNNNWEEGAVGGSSFAAGYNPKATASFSIAIGRASEAIAESAIALGDASYATAPSAVALGKNNTASGDNSVSIGENNIASGDKSVSLGMSANASGLGAISIGHNISSVASYCTTLGFYNNNADVPNGSNTDRLFQIGNGTVGNRLNAITILKNGNIGIGNNAVNPEFIMDFGGRPRIRHNGATAGLFLNNSQNVPNAFVGMKTDNQIGFFLDNEWQFWIDKNGNSYIAGGLYNVSSDKRLKTNIIPLDNSLSKINQINGYNFNWKAENRSKKLVTGIIAQEIEAIFPNLVGTDEKGYLTVNYDGLIPHLIEAVKELDKKTEEISALKKELASVQEMNKKLTALEASVKELLAGQAGTSTQTGK